MDQRLLRGVVEGLLVAEEVMIPYLWRWALAILVCLLEWVVGKVSLYHHLPCGFLRLELVGVVSLWQRFSFEG